MSSRLPPLPALRAFEAAARHSSYSKAAAELFVTHGAVSHQIKALERHLELKLFRRSGHDMLLTEAGQKLHVHVREGFARLYKGVDEVRAQARPQMLNVSVLPGFAARWLVPRLPAFYRICPNAVVILRASHALVDLDREGVDIAVRYGLGRWPGLHAEKLMDENVFPVCSPRYREGRLPRSAKDLPACDLLHDLYQPWDDWFRAVGVTPPVDMRGARFSDSNLLLNAAVDGQGVALALGAHVQKELESGQLVRCSGRSPTTFSYYVVHREMAELPANVQAFKEWLHAQVESERTPPKKRAARTKPRKTAG